MVSTSRIDPETPLLSAEALSYSYDDLRIFENLSFSLGEKSFLSLLGPSGCGKTTLLNLIAGFLKPTSGLMNFGGTPIAGPGPDRAMVFQSGALFEWLTVRDNIEFSLRCLGTPIKERREVSDEMVELVGLQGFEDKFIYQLSGGMRQRVVIAMALACKPSLII